MTLRILPATVVGDLRRLESLAIRVFGAGDRPPGWFARKLHRECVDPELSRIAVDGDAEDPNNWKGYVLVGTPGSVHPAARTAGTGVVPEERGRGLGHRLVRDAFAATLRAGLRALQVPADPQRTEFYLHLGFEPVRHEVTLLGFGTGGSDPSWGSHASWSLRHERLVAQWLQEAWARDESDAHAEVILRAGASRARVLLSREGQARVVHRLLVSGDTLDDHGLAALLERLRAEIQLGAPLLLLGIPPYLPLVELLTASGWIVAQRCQIMERRVEEDTMG